MPKKHRALQRSKTVRFLTTALMLAVMAVVARGQATPTRFSRRDLTQLKKRDRAGVFAALRSFDDQGLTEQEFALRAFELFDPKRVPGLAVARHAGDLPRALAAVFQACQGERIASSGRRVRASVIAAANDVLENRFSFYGEKHQLPEDIDWDANPGTAHWGHDLNRFSYLTPLMQAYTATGDPRYSRKAAGLVLDWIAKCEAERCFKGSPYVWGSYLNNAIHCQAWCAQLPVLVAADQITPIELLRVLKSVHDQLAYLEIVTNGHSGNWPTIGIQAMLQCAGTFPILRDTDRFADYCAETLKVQVADQVLPDGVQYELTPHYHRVVINNLLNAARWLRALGRDLDSQTLEVLGKMIHYSQQTTVPDGSKQVAFNDSDPGSVGNYASALASLGLQRLLSPPERLGPEVFPYAGVAFLRQRQDVGDLYLAFDAGPYGRSHQHEDKLGFWLFAYGRSFLVDPGRHLYDWSARSYLPYLRSTAAHSAIRVDGQDQHSRGKRSTWVARKPLDLAWTQTKGEIRATGLYDLGYGPKNDIAVTHRRQIVFVDERYWVVFDVVEGEGEHLLESRFQFAPGSLQVEGMTVQTQFPDANLLLRTIANAAFTDVHVAQGQENPRSGWYSDGYNKIEPAPTLSLSVRTTLPWRAATLLFPYQGATSPTVSFRFDGCQAIIEQGNKSPSRVVLREDRPAPRRPE